MAEALTWLIVLLLIALAIWSVARDGERKRRRTAADFEREVVESRNTLARAGMLELDRFVSGDLSGRRAAVEFLKDEEQGQTKTGGKDDDADRTESEKLP